METKRADFFIISKPTEIQLTCPYCNEEINIPWFDIDEPSDWGDDWGWVECPICNKVIKLGDHEI